MKSKLHKLVALITNNFGLKLLAVIVSLGLWFVVNSINDPLEKARFYNISVEIINGEQFANSGKVYEIIENTGTVNVEVTGKRSVLRYITKENIRAVADMEKLTILDTVGIEFSSTRNNSELEFKGNIDSVKLLIDDIMHAQMRIEALVSGEPAKGYIAGSVTLSPNVVALQGPKAAINRIKHVEAVVNINDEDVLDISTSADLKLYDANKKEIKNDSIKMNISAVNAAVPILATKEIPLEFIHKGEPAQGYIANGINKSEPAVVTLAGKKAVLDAVEKLSISDAALSLEGVTQNLNATVNIKKYLPTGIQLAEGSYNGDVSVEIGVEPLVVKDLMIPAKNIAAGFGIHEKPDGLDAAIESLEDREKAQLKVRISGTRTAVDDVDEAAVIGVIDMEKVFEDMGLGEWMPGRYEGEVVFDFKIDDNAKINTDRIYKLAVVLSDNTDNSE